MGFLCKNTHKYGIKMIDTIKIAVPLNLVTFRSYDNFNIDALYLERVLSWQAAPIKAPFKPYREHTTDEKNTHGYLPEISISMYPNQIGFCVIRFSAPIMLYGNNIREIKETDFTCLIITLQAKLKHLNIDISLDDISNAYVWEVHTCKNIDLTNYSSTDTVLSTLNKLHFAKIIQKGETKFYNTEIQKESKDGRKVNIVCYKPGSKSTPSYEICFYDKLEELKKTAAGTEILNNNPELSTKTDIIRFEYRIYRTQMLRSKLSQCELDQDISFKNIFKNQIIKKLNKNIWSRIIDPALYILPYLNRKTDSLWEKIEKLNLKPMKSLYAYSIYKTFSKEGFDNIPQYIINPKTKVLNKIKTQMAQIYNIKPTKIQTTIYHIKNEILNNNPFI